MTETETETEETRENRHMDQEEEYRCQLYDKQRIDRISKIVPVFTTHAMVGDRIVFGLEGDPLFPRSYQTARPCGVITKIKNHGKPSATLRVRMDRNGKHVDIDCTNVGPDRLWEFEPGTYEKVVERSTPVEERESVKEHGGGAAHVSLSTYDQLRERVETLACRLEAASLEDKNFRKAMVASMSELANELSNTTNGSEKSFSSQFAKEYKTMQQNNPDVPDKAFDSDFSD